MPKVDLKNHSEIKKHCVPPAQGETTAEGNVRRDMFYWDTATEGFGVRVKADGTKWFVVQRCLPGTTKSLRQTIGQYGAITLTDARKAADRFIGKVSSGVNPIAEIRRNAVESLPKKWETMTLADAIEEHVGNMTDCQPSSIAQLRRELADPKQGNLYDWLKTPLIEIDAGMCIDRHRKLSKKSGKRGGPVCANRTMAYFRSCWNSARKRYPQLPPCPTVAVTFHKRQRKQSPLPWEVLPDWYDAVMDIQNGVRRDLQLCFLFTGSSGRGLKTLRWENINFKKGTIHFPKPKGGEDRAFTVPASAWLLAVLAKRQLENRRTWGDTPWVFPCRNKLGQIVPTVDSDHDVYVEKGNGTSAKKRPAKRHFFQYVSDKGKTENARSHRLRDTFATACFESEIGLTETQVLMNHRAPRGSVTEGYYSPSLEHLRKCVETVTAFLLNKIGIQRQARRKGAA